MRVAPLAALLLSLAVPAAAQEAATHDPAKAEGGSFEVDRGHTQVLFAVNHMGFSRFYGQFTSVSGTLELDPVNPAASRLSVTFPTGLVSTSSEKLTAELAGSDWLDARANSRITFASTKVEPTGAGSARVTGDLTLHGVTKPVTLDVTFTGAGRNPMSKRYTVGFEAKGSLDRSQFGVTKYVPLIGDKVDLILTGAFERKE